MRRYAATDPLFVGACEPTVAVTCYGHMATSSTTIPVDGRTNRILSLPFTYFNPCSPSMAARLSGWFNKQLPKARSVSDAPQLNSAAAAASVQRVRDLWKQVFVSKKQDRPEQSCYPIPSNSGSFGQRGLNAGVGRRGTTRAAPFSFICLFCRCRHRRNQPKARPRSCCPCKRATCGAYRSSGPMARSTISAGLLPRKLLLTGSPPMRG